jgi:cytidine deaminase
MDRETSRSPDHAGRVQAAIEAARAVRQHAYAPYSGFRVGAALVSRDGHIFVGCNVENAAFPSSVCAERGALMQAVASGARELVTLVIVTDAAVPTPPCGACRQMLSELAPELEIVSVGSASERRWRMDELLPDAFGRASLVMPRRD